MNADMKLHRISHVWRPKSIKQNIDMQDLACFVLILCTTIYGTLCVSARCCFSFLALNEIFVFLNIVCEEEWNNAVSSISSELFHPSLMHLAFFLCSSLRRIRFDENRCHSINLKLNMIFPLSSFFHFFSWKENNASGERFHFFFHFIIGTIS